METVHDTDVVFEAVAESGLRATIGKCMMDFDAQVPERLQEETRTSIDESLRDPQALARRAQTAGCAPRSRRASRSRARASCSRRSPPVGRAAAALVHTHASESRDEIAIVRKISGGLSNLEYLGGHRSRLAAPVRRALRLGGRRASSRLLAEHDVKVMHCPGSNLKLGSGIAPVPEMRARGITVSLGADGAACNNRLDMFEEMRLAAVLQAMRHAARASLPARDVLWMATRAGARTLGLEQRDRHPRARQERRPHRRRSGPPARRARIPIRRSSMRRGERRAHHDRRRRVLVDEVRRRGRSGGSRRPRPEGPAMTLRARLGRDLRRARGPAIMDR